MLLSVIGSRRGTELVDPPWPGLNADDLAPPPPPPPHWVGARVARVSRSIAGSGSMLAAADASRSTSLCIDPTNMVLIYAA
jgi:hypothetical protein